MKKLYFIADTKRGGDLGNYWHYMLGYFLPIVTYLRKNKEIISSKELVFDSCNPLTDAILMEYLDELKVRYSFEKLTEKGIEVPRADWKSVRGKIRRQLLKLELALRGEHASIFTYHKFRVKADKILIPRWDRYLDEYGSFSSPVKKDLKGTILHLKLWAKSDQSREEIIVIERSRPPSILKSTEGKEARWLPNYGTERRQLKNGEEINDFLKSQGYNARRFFPGDESLKLQIDVFSKAKVLIGIRGAELLNMIWMLPEAKVIMQESADFKNEAIQIKLANAFDLELKIIPHDGQISPSLNPEHILTYLING
ncbi:glycosyltransferase 61 family protein [Algoriphagus sediminis]|uniref:Glycosyltransferase family 61 protein n=1 Tax=Algoriphagus sediminis TaxID=3057113 RepID=A0ABT7YGH3_9BACT|nr:glycosyltransferase family 61 protein [Algoriphagus sediminis]MDN3205573.1 glycosyltransferase family 61 protein [Algoriphagus sediminis]